MSWSPFWTDAEANLGLLHVPQAIWQAGGVSKSIPIGDLAREDRFSELRRRLSQSALFLNRDFVRRAPVSFNAQEIGALSAVGEILQRGELVPMHPNVEGTLLQAIDEKANKLTLSYGAFSVNQMPLAEATAAAYKYLARRTPTAALNVIDRFEDEFDSGSAERRFWEIVIEQFPRLSNFLHPQVPLAALLSEQEGFGEDDRRADFVLALRSSIES